MNCKTCPTDSRKKQSHAGTRKTSHLADVDSWKTKFRDELNFQAIQFQHILQKSAYLIWLLCIR